MGFLMEQNCHCCQKFMRNGVGSGGTATVEMVYPVIGKTKKHLEKTIQMVE